VRGGDLMLQGSNQWAPGLVTESQCKERRDTCKEGRCEDRDTRDAWINKLEKKIDAIIWLVLVQLLGLFCGLIILVITGKL
jgi:hypothetical protein